MKRTVTFGLTAMFSLAFGIASADAAISLTNGSFETPALPVNSYQTGFADTSWQQSLTDSVAGGIVRENIFGFELVNNGKAPDGVQWAFLRESSYIYQAIGSVNAGERIDVSFVQYMQSNIGNTSSGLSIEIWNGNPTSGGSLLDAAIFGGLAPTVLAQRQATLDPGGAVSDLYFVVRAINDIGNNNVSFDNIVLSVVPEPASLALIAAGGLLLVRRRRVAHG